MEHKKDIGKAIREKLDALDKAPSDHLWAAIEADLPKKKKRRLLPFWITLISVVIIGLLFWTLVDGNGLTEGNNGINAENPTVNGIGNDFDKSRLDDASTSADGADKNAAESDSEKQFPKHDAANGQSTDLIHGDQNHERVGAKGHRSFNNNTASPTVKGKKQAAFSTRRPSQSLATAKNNTAKKKSKKSKKTSQKGQGDIGYGNAISDIGSANRKSAANTTTIDTAAAGNQAKTEQEIKAANDSIAKAIVQDKKKKREKPKDSLPKEEQQQESFKTFSVFVYAAPTYYNTLAKSSALDRRLDSLSRKAEITFNYGGYLCFEYNDKWSIRIGYARTNFKQRTTGIAVSSLNQQNYYNIDYGNISNSELQDLFADSQHFDLIQELTYTELPVEIKYKVVTGKFGVEPFAGFSTNLLTGSTVTAESDLGQSYVLGSLKDQYKFYFSANVGIGLYWRFANNFRLNVEPVFKYHFRTAGTPLKPYSAAVLGGIEYTFNWKSTKKKE